MMVYISQFVTIGCSLLFMMHCGILLVHYIGCNVMCNVGCKGVHVFMSPARTSGGQCTPQAQQSLYFLRTLKKTNLSADLLKSFYHCSVESILCYSITARNGNCTAADKAALQREDKAAQKRSSASPWLFWKTPTGHAVTAEPAGF